jgi:hypothetical protein
MTEYTATVFLDMGVAGDIEIEQEIDIDEDWMHEAVTQDNDCEWAEEHFCECCDITEFIGEQLQSMEDEDVLKMFAERLGIDTDNL